MYDSPEAAEQITLTGWVSKGKDGRFFYKDEDLARYAGCTHKLCDCGNIMKKGWTKCESCRNKLARERYLKYPYEEWQGEPVFEAFGSEYFFNEEDLIDYMTQDEDDIIEEIELLKCDPIYYSPIETETIAPDSDDFEPDEELKNKMNEFNEYLKTLPPHSWTSGKIRTSYKLSQEIINEIKGTK
jgi:hypothetical protein